MLKDELQTYIDQRSAEFEKTHKTHLKYFLWVIPLGHDWKSKVEAAVKLSLDLSGDSTVKYSDYDFDVLGNARLGELTKKYKDQLPPAFVAQRSAWLQRIREQQETEHLMHIASSSHFGMRRAF